MSSKSSASDSGRPSALPSGSRSGIVSTDPATLSPSLVYDKDVGVTITGSGASSWSDQSGNGYTATQSTDSLRPTSTSAGLTGDGTDDFIATSVPRRTITGDSHYTVVAVITPRGPGGGSSNYSANPAIFGEASPNRAWGCSITNTEKLICGHFNGGFKQVSVSAPHGQETILTWRYDGSNVEARTDNNAYISAASSVGAQLSVPVLSLFNMASASSASISDLSIWSSALSDLEVDGVVTFYNDLRAVY